MNTTRPSVAIRRAALTLLCAVVVAVSAACSGDPVIGRPVAASPPTTGQPDSETGEEGPTADIDADSGPAEPTRTFPPGGPVPCEAKFDRPLCLPAREVSLKPLHRDLTKRGWDCYREGQTDDAGLEVSDSFECRGGGGKAGPVSVHQSISGNIYFSKKPGPLEQITVSATAAEIDSGSGPKPADRRVQKHAVLSHDSANGPGRLRRYHKRVLIDSRVVADGAR